MSRIDALCDRWEAWLRANAPEALESLRPGATDDDITVFEQLIGWHLPKDVRAWFRRHNGQRSDRDPHTLPIHCTHFSLDDAYEKWRDWQDVAYYNDEHADATCLPPEAIQPAYSLPGWIPLAGFQSDYWGVDLNPGPRGIVGQVINFGRNEDRKYVVGATWADLLETLVEEMERGNIAVEDSWVGGHRWFIDESSGNPSDFVDIVPELYRLGLFDGRRLHFPESADSIVP